MPGKVFGLLGYYIKEHYDPENGTKVDNRYFDLPQGAGLGICPAKREYGHCWHRLPSPTICDR